MWNKLLPFLLAVGLIALPTFVEGATVKELDAQKQALEQRAKQYEQQANQKQTEAEKAAALIKQVNNEINYLDSALEQTTTAIQETGTQVAEKNQDLARLESDLRRIGDQQNAMVRELYKLSVSQDSDIWMFGNEKLSVREEQEAQVAALRRSVAEVYKKTQEARAQVERNRDTLSKKREDLLSLQSQQQAQEEGLADTVALQKRLKANAQSAAAEYASQANSAKLQLAKIEQQISAALTAALNAAKAGQALGAGTGIRVNAGDIIGHLGSTGFSTGPHVHFEVRANGSAVDPMPYLNNGTFNYPVGDYTITQGFGYTSWAQSGAYGGSIHTGVDLAGPYGQAVRAAAGGTIVLSQYYGGYGNAVAIQHDNGLVTLYGHMTGK